MGGADCVTAKTFAVVLSAVVVALAITSFKLYRKLRVANGEVVMDQIQLVEVPYAALP